MEREKRFEVYEKMLIMAKEDLVKSRDCGISLYGFCFLAQQCDSEIIFLKELMEYKPSTDDFQGYWFDDDPFSRDATKRIEILQEILSKK
jgi:hypothetical protein